MANEKVFQSRIQLKHDIEENWLKAINFVPKEGEIVIYDSDSNNPTPRFKIGDGVTVIGSLPFVAAQADWNITDESDSGYIKNKPNYDKIVTDLEELSTNVAYINKENNENIESPDIAASSVIIDSALSRTSTNPVQNATITAELDTIKDAKADWNQNDETAADFVRNRPFKAVGEGLEVDEDGVLSVHGIKKVTHECSFTDQIELADATEYKLTNVAALTLIYPDGEFECWLKLTFAAENTIAVTYPEGTKFIGKKPEFTNGDIWEVSIKDGVVISQKVGDGT